MRRAGCMALIVVIGLLVLGYNQFRMEQMRSELAAISSKFHVNSANKSTASGKTDMVTALAQAEAYTRHAKQLIAKKKISQAQVELDKALKSLKSANTVSSDIVGDAAGYLGKARDNAINVFQKAWKDISEEAKTKKVDVKKP